MDRKTGHIGRSGYEILPPSGPRVRIHCLSGVGKAGMKSVLHLDVDKVRSVGDLFAAAEVQATGAGGVEAP